MRAMILVAGAALAVAALSSNDGTHEMTDDDKEPARPTADLGEDSAAMLYQEAGQLDDPARANAIRQAADRLILYREARAGLADEIAVAMQKERDTIGATEQQRIAFGYAEAAMRAVLSRSGG